MPRPEMMELANGPRTRVRVVKHLAHGLRIVRLSKAARRLKTVKGHAQYQLVTKHGLLVLVHDQTEALEDFAILVLAIPGAVEACDAPDKDAALNVRIPDCETKSMARAIQLENKN